MIGLMNSPQTIHPREKAFFLLNGYVVTPHRLTLAMIADLLQALECPEAAAATLPWLLHLKPD